MFIYKESLSKQVEEVQHKMNSDSHNSSQEISQLRDQLQESNEKITNLTNSLHLSQQSLQAKNEEITLLSQTSAENVDRMFPIKKICSFCF